MMDSLTDGQGRKVDFKNTVIILTSNIGSPLIQDFYTKGKKGEDDQAEMGVSYPRGNEALFQA